MSFIIALIIGLVGAVLIFFKTELEINKRIGIFGTLSAIYTSVGWILIYANIPSSAWPLFGVYGLFLVSWWIITCVIGSAPDEGIGYEGLFPISYVLLVIIVASSGAEMFNSNRYATLIGTIQDKTQKHWSQDIQPLDPNHIRLVPKELAISLAKTTLSKDGSTLGSQFPLDETSITLQKIKENYCYLIPLDYNGFKVWTQTDSVPGYVRVSATDPYAKPELVTNLKMKYTPGAFFGDNMMRRLWHKYRDKILKDYCFEEDDNGHVFWVITVCHPAIRYWGEVVDGIIIYDPISGNDKFIPKGELEKDPAYAWVDRAMPSELVESYIDYWGALKDGWLNSFWTHKNLLGGETPILNYSSAGRCVIVTPVTSTNLSDHSMTGLIYTDARTGESIYYTTSGGATEQAVIDAVNSAISYKQWHANEQIVYENVYGKLAALVPILGANGNYQGLAIVENENKRVAIGTTPQEALVEFQKMVMSHGGQITTENAKDVLEFTGKISRIGWDISGSGKQYYVYFPNFKHAFALSSNVQSELPLTREGDEVSIKYINSDQAAVPVMFFKNITLGLEGGKNEQAVTTQMVERKTATQDKADVKDFKESLKNMSDDEIKSLMKK